MTMLRRGAATVEVAFTLPILLAFLLGGWELSKANMLRNTVDNAAYEGARQAILPGATATAVQAKANVILDAVAAVGATVSVSPDPIPASASEVTVTVRVPVAANDFGIAELFTSGEYVGSCTLTRELKTRDE